MYSIYIVFTNMRGPCYYLFTRLCTYIYISMIRFLQANLNNCRAAQDLLVQSEKDRRIGISLISEPYRIPVDDNTWIANKLSTAAIHFNMQETHCMGIAQRIGRFVVSVRWRETTIVSCYITPNCGIEVYEEFLDEVDECVADATGDIIIGGDFNSKSILWGNKATDSRGDRLVRWSASHDMTILNTGNTPTCIRHQGTSVIDLTWCNSTLKPRISRWEVLSDESLSDHLYIYFVLDTKKNSNIYKDKKKKYVRWAYKKMDVDKFKEALEWCCVGQAPMAREEISARWAQEKIQSACDFHAEGKVPSQRYSLLVDSIDCRIEKGQSGGTQKVAKIKN